MIKLHFMLQHLFSTLRAAARADRRPSDNVNFGISGLYRSSLLANEQTRKWYPPPPTLPFVAGDYKYDVRVEACSGTSSFSVQAYFCSSYTCNQTIGEEVPVLLEMNDEDGGETTTSVYLPFNPIAMRLAAVDDDW